jgi:hypothetical protein
MKLDHVILYHKERQSEIRNFSSHTMPQRSGRKIVKKKKIDLFFLPWLFIVTIIVTIVIIITVVIIILIVVIIIFIIIIVIIFWLRSTFDNT